MKGFLKNVFLCAVGLLLFLTLYTFLLSYVWHRGGFRWIYQFAVSAGLVGCAFYFFLLSGGVAAARIAWGLLFLVLSPAAYLLSEAIFWPGGLPASEGTAGGALRYAGGVDVLGFLMEARVGPAVPVLLLAVVGFAVGNAVFFARRMDRGRFIGGNLLLVAWTALMYWMAYRPL